MKRIVLWFLILILPVASALADPLTLLDDYAEDIVEPCDEEDPAAGTFVYSCRYPHVDDSAEGGAGINVFYSELLEYELGFTMPMIQETFGDSASSTVITYTVTCNSDDYFSVLIRKEENNPDISRVHWTGNVFLRAGGDTGLTSTLPQLLGILDAAENDTWLQERQTARADAVVREMVWKMIGSGQSGISWNADFTEDELSHVFFPEEDFYLDETGNPVFFIQPGVAAPEDAGLITFPLRLEDILDEL